AMARLREQGCEHILTVPLYPQYAASTTATVVDAVAAHAARLRDQPELRFIKRFHADPGYLDALAARIAAYWQAHGRPQKLVMSFHGLPRYSIELGDPYYRDCLETARLLRERLGLAADQVEVTFQSRFGAARWLEPYTEPTLKALAAGRGAGGRGGGPGLRGLLRGNPRGTQPGRPRRLSGRGWPPVPVPPRAQRRSGLGRGACGPGRQSLTGLAQGPGCRPY